MARNRNRLGQLDLSNLFTLWPDVAPGEPHIRIAHTVDNKTLWVFGGIAVGSVILGYSLNKFF